MIWCRIPDDYHCPAWCKHVFDNILRSRLCMSKNKYEVGEVLAEFGKNFKLVRSREEPLTPETSLINKPHCLSESLQAADHSTMSTLCNPFKDTSMHLRKIVQIWNCISTNSCSANSKSKQLSGRDGAPTTGLNHVFIPRVSDRSYD